MEQVTSMGRLYSFGRPDKMSVPVHTPPSPPEVKYGDDISLGPYYAHYWSLVGGNLESDGMPIASNGAYISPYGSAPEHFFTELQEPVPPLDEVPWSTPVSGVGDGLFTHSRSTSYGPMNDSNPYTPPMDGVSWGQFGHSSDSVLQIQSLPALENLANQILTTLISGTAEDFVNTISSPDDEGKGQAYATVEALFEQHKRIFSRGRLFIDPNAIPLNNPVFPRVARKTNLATFVTCIFRGQDIPFLDLDDSFLDIFMPAGTRLLKGEGALYLELKTQAFITIMMNGGAKKEDVLDKLFPQNLQLAILRRRPEPTHLAPSEADFIARVNTRKQYLSTGASTIESLAALPQKYNWKGFLEEVSSCVRRVLENMDSMKVSLHHLAQHI
jgi:Telomere repeat binding factor (TRF)